MQLPASNKPRAAFTLVELLIVIAIIGILVALLSAGLYMAFARSKDAVNANDINQLSIALENFKQKFGMYPPSRIRLVESGLVYNNPAAPIPLPGTISIPFYNVTINPATGQPVNYLDYYSVAMLKQMWPRISLTTWPNMPPASGLSAIDWNGDGNIYYCELMIGDFTLEGDQCLVFFLGGIPNASTPGTLGFSSNPANPSPTSPANQVGAPVMGQLIGPYYSFQSNRLVLLHPTFNATCNYPNNFFSYLDIYGNTSNPLSKPFAYFSAARGQKNKYIPGWHPTTGVTSDCQTIGAMPYCTPVPAALPLTVPAMYANPDSYQIISAGADQQFGSQVPGTPIAGYYGVVWNASTTPPTFSIGTNLNPFPQFLPNGHQGVVTAGGDDRTNFCANILMAGNAQN